jgi:4-amino-4-deoxy-L-arabinose transferase-like glycosyltransferase
MALKWTGVLVAVFMVTLCVTANVLVAALSDHKVPGVVNIFAVVGAGTATVVAVLAELFDRINARLDALTDLFVARFEEIDSHTGDRNAGFVEGYLLSQGQDAAIVPLRPRTVHRRAITGGED